MPLWVIHKFYINYHSLSSVRLAVCICSPKSLPTVLFWDVTLHRLVNRYKLHSVTFQKRVHNSSAAGTAGWPVILNSNDEETQGFVSPEANISVTNLNFSPYLSIFFVFQRLSRGAHTEFFGRVGGGGGGNAKAIHNFCLILKIML